MSKQRPNPEGDDGEWWWFRYSPRSDWQAVFVKWMSKHTLGVMVTGVVKFLNIESMDGECGGRILPPS